VAKAKTWDQRLREQIKGEHGQGWSVGPQSGRTKLTRRHRDGTRSAVMLDIPWAVGSSRRISNKVAHLQHLMQERNLGLAEANQLSSSSEAIETNGTETEAINWGAVAEAFLESRSDRRCTTLRDLRMRVKNALTTLRSKPHPRDGRSLLRSYAAQHFGTCPPGGQGRKRHLGDIAAFLDFAVDRCGAESRWRPLEGEELQELIGTSDRSISDALTPPIKPDQLAGLLDALTADGRDDLWLAVALVGLYGLRPAELAALRVEEGRLYVSGQVKRNRQTMRVVKADRPVLPLDIPGREGEGARALALFESGSLQLPLPIRTAIESDEFKRVGDAFRQLLDRYPHWQQLVAATPGLTPYSLRHGWAWRAHKAYERQLSVRDASALLGHSPSTHHRHYGRWVDEQGLLEAVARLTDRVQARA